MKRCCDCRYTRGIGYDFWCGEGHTEYEVFGAETNCPYYEYHDWSKGTPSMTKNKRFTVIRKKNQVSKEMGNYVQDRGTTILKLGFFEDCNDVCDILNYLNDECEFLEIENEALEHAATKYAELCHKTLKENKQLKAQLYCDEEEDVKEDYLTLSCKELHKLKKENELLKMHMKSARAYLEGGYTKKAIERLQIADR